MHNNFEITSNFSEYKNAFLEENSKHNLISKNDEKFLYEKHIYDSLALKLFLNKYNINAGTILDIGCGGGFPSVPLAIELKSFKITGIDSINKKINSVNCIKEKLGLKNLELICDRAENLNKKYDIVVSRAVANLEKLSKNEASSNTDEIAIVPKGGFFLKILGWLIPAIIIGLIAAGFIYGGVHAGAQMLSTWFLYNAIPAAILTAVACGHPLAILVGFIGAPFTSLCPFIGIGFCTAIVQAIVCKPKVSDMESLQDDVTSLRGFYKNRILRTLIVELIMGQTDLIGLIIQK